MPRRPKGLKGVLWGRACDAAGLALPCSWCGRPMSYAAATVDHEPALGEGGRPRMAVLACYPCNQERGRATNTRIKQGRSKGRRMKKGRGR